MCMLSGSNYSSRQWDGQSQTTSAKSQFNNVWMLTKSSFRNLPMSAVQALYLCQEMFDRLMSLLKNGCIILMSVTSYFHLQDLQEVPLRPLHAKLKSRQMLRSRTGRENDLKERQPREQKGKARKALRLLAKV